MVADGERTIVVGDGQRYRRPAVSARESNVGMTVAVEVSRRSSNLGLGGPARERAAEHVRLPPEHAVVDGERIPRGCLRDRYGAPTSWSGDREIGLTVVSDEIAGNDLGSRSPRPAG